MRHGSVRMGVLGLLLLAAGGVSAADVTFTGTVSYSGPYSGDTLFVAVLDTTGSDDAQVLDLVAYEVVSKPISQGYSLTFDNAGVSPTVVVASFLDVDGGGVSDISGADVFGWFPGAAEPVGVSSASSQTGLDFALPEAEIHGTLTFASGQTEAELELSSASDCLGGGFRPPTRKFTDGAYSIVGIYAGSYCLQAFGFGTGAIAICYGDPNCVSPTTISLGPTQVVNGIDLDFNLVPVEGTTWGRLKARYGR